MVVRRLTVDYERGTMAVQLVDGTLIAPPAAGTPAPPLTPLRRAVCDLVSRELTLTLPDNGEVTVELGAAGGADPPIGRRPIVYLDQRDWVTLAQQIRAPEKVGSATVRTAAAHLITLARAKRVVLPMSAAHLAEAPLRGRRRRDLVTTMLDLSRGWQMRNPLAVRQLELRAALIGDPRAAVGVVTLDPDALFSDPAPGPPPPSDFPPEWQELHQRLTAVTALYSAAIEDNVEPKDRAREMALRWANPHHRLAVYHRDSKKSAANVRINARAYLLGDLATEIADAASAVGLDQQTFNAWVLQGSEQHLPSLPYLGRAYEVLCQRLRNADDHWKANDLVDMTFLPCAAGYATVVVGENKTIDYLRRVQERVPPGARVCSTLPAAIDHLNELGAA